MKRTVSSPTAGIGAGVDSTSANNLAAGSRVSLAGLSQLLAGPFVYTLRLLGSAILEESGGPVKARAGQGRRLALLAILELARGRALSRDKVVGLLWPEASPERARPQLSDALYVVRGTLGEDAIRSTGDGLMLDPDIVTSDVAQFERLLAESRLEEAVGLYRGPLLDGFHISASTEFESWVDGERAGLDRQYAQALEALAEAAEAGGDPEAAAAWWRRRAAHDPFNGRAALGLMRALEAAGDRAGALQHARIHAALLREEFDAEPDAELTAYVERLRREPPPPQLRRAEPAPVPPPPTAALPTAAPPGQEVVAEPVPDRSPSGEPARRGRGRFVAGAVALVLALSLGLAYGTGRFGAPATEARSIGVLPFVNMSPDPANSYLSDGLSEQIILALSRIDGLHVAARTSSFALRDRALSVRAIADTLDVQAVLEGSILVDGERLRVIAQLIDAQTGYHIWSEQYDGELGGVFAMQDSVAIAIADALHLRLAGREPAPAGNGPGLEAYDLYLRGLQLRNSLSAEALRQASEYFDGAIALEPRFAEAWAAKASVTAAQAYFRYATRDSVIVQLRTLIARALQLDPMLGEAHASLGVLKLFYEWDWSAAEAALLRAIELNPNDAHAWHHLGNYYSAMGDHEKAAWARERSARLDPLNARTRIVLSRAYLFTGDYERALDNARQAERLDPVHPLLLGTGPYLPFGAGEVLRAMGRSDEAVEEYVRVATLRGATLKELDDMRAAYTRSGMSGFWKEWIDLDLRQSGDSPDPVRMAALRMLTADTARALDLLERAFDERNPSLIYIRREPVFDGLRTQPRFQRIVSGMRFPD